MTAVLGICVEMHPAEWIVALAMFLWFLASVMNRSEPPES